MNDLSNKIAFITGSTSGIGEACAKRFALAGASVIVSGRNPDRGNSVVKSIIDNGGKAAFCELDITDEQSIDNCVKFIKKEYGCIDILFNNAGIFPVTNPLETIDRKSTNMILDTNVSGLIMVLHSMLAVVNPGGGNIE